MTKYITLYNESVFDDYFPHWGKSVPTPGWDLGSGVAFFGRNPKKKVKPKKYILDLREFLKRHQSFNK